MIIRQPPKLTNKQTLIEHIEVKIWNWLKELSTGLLKLNFRENFQTFQVSDLKIPANTEITISNGFNTTNNGVIPSARLITRQRGDAIIVDGDTKWTVKNVYLKNVSANDAVINVVFFK
jgi:hypothetical protein